MLPSERIEAFGWIQGKVQDDSGARCIMGSLVDEPLSSKYLDRNVAWYRAIYEEAVATYGADRMDALLQYAVEKLESYGVGSGLVRTGLDYSPLYHWNDWHEETTKEEVVAVLQAVGL